MMWPVEMHFFKNSCLGFAVNVPGGLQIAKLLVIPFVCLVEAFWLGRTFSASVIFSIATVVFGVAIV